MLVSLLACAHQLVITDAFTSQILKRTLSLSLFDDAGTFYLRRFTCLSLKLDRLDHKREANGMLRHSLATLEGE